MNLTSLRRKLSEYQNFYEEVRNLVFNLKTAIDYLLDASNSIQNVYQYNDESADKNKLITDKRKLENDIDSLERDIIPAIKSKIRMLERQIEDAELAMSMRG